MATETTGTLSNSAVAILAVGGGGGKTRKELIVSNNSDTVMTYRIGGSTADANTGISIPAGTALKLTGPQAREAGSLFCAGASKAYSYYER